MSTPEKFDDFELGMLCAAAFLARHGEDTLAVEVATMIGVDTARDLAGRGLDRFDGNALRKLFRRIG
jgi:hypothetical protein